jgi:hypothetical protein
VRTSASCPSCRICFASRVATGARDAAACAVAIAAGSSSAASKTRFTSPIRSASSASIGSPTSTSCFAQASPTRRTSRLVPPKPGISPSFVSG